MAVLPLLSPPAEERDASDSGDTTVAGSTPRVSGPTKYTSRRRSGPTGGSAKGPNLRDVASACGVSVATVSLVLNNSPRISRATRVRVQGVMEKLGYQPNRLAQSLSGKYTNVLAVVLPAVRHAFADAYFGELLSGVTDQAHACGYKVLLEVAKPEYVASGKHIELFERRHVDGVLLMGASDNSALADDLTREKCHAVVVDNRLQREASSSIDYVSSDYARGGEQAMNYLRQLGHKRVGFLYAAPEIATIRDVQQAWAKAMTGAGLDEAELARLQEDGEFTERGGASAMSRLLRNVPDVTAVLATNDKMAIGAMHLLDRRGIRIPDRMSVVGFDDLQHAAYVNPSLTTIHLPLYEVGQRACQRLIERIRGREEPVAETLRTHLVVRDSTGMARRPSESEA